MTTPAKNNTAVKMTAKDMTALLHAHYIPENRPAVGIFAPEIQSPDGKRFADAIWQSTTRSGGMLLVGHEIKVSRADVMLELADPSKAESWMQYCDQWWLTISDPTLIDGLDIPTSWGVMSPPSGRRKRSMTIIKEAPHLKPIAKDAGLLRLLTWQSAKHARDIQTANMYRDSAERQSSHYQSQLAQYSTISNQNPQHQLVNEIVKKLQERLDAEPRNQYGYGSSYLSTHTDVDVIVDSIYDAKIIRAANTTILQNARHVARVLNDVETHYLKDAREKIATLDEYLKQEPRNGLF